MSLMPGEMRYMTPDEMFQKAIDGWGIEVASPVEDFSVKRVLFYGGKPLGVTWSPEVAQDLAAFHGEDVAQKLVLMLIDQTARALMGMEPEDSE